MSNIRIHAREKQTSYPPSVRLACMHVRASLHRVPAGADKNHGRHLSIDGETKKKLIWRADGDDASDDAIKERRAGRKVD